MMKLNVDVTNVTKYGSRKNEMFTILELLTNSTIVDSVGRSIHFVEPRVVSGGNGLVPLLHCNGKEIYLIHLNPSNLLFLA
jgi:hypothetical protein